MSQLTRIRQTVSLLVAHVVVASAVASVNVVAKGKGLIRPAQPPQVN